MLGVEELVPPSLLVVVLSPDDELELPAPVPPELRGRFPTTLNVTVNATLLGLLNLILRAPDNSLAVNAPSAPTLAVKSQIAPAPGKPLSAFATVTDPFAEVMLASSNLIGAKIVCVDVFLILRS